MPPRKQDNLTVAVTGPTGTFGFGLMPLLQDSPRVARIIGIARRPFDPAEHGWTKMDYRQGDVRDPDALGQAFAGADVVVHLAFMITGNASRATIRAINIDGTLNTFTAAAQAGATRFVYASSVAAYGFHSDNPVGMDEDWPTRPAAHLFYAQEKAELEQRLRDAAAEHPGLELYLLRPPIVLGPHAAGAKGGVPEPVAAAARKLLGALDRAPVQIPLPAPAAPVQFIHEDDVGQALLACVLGDGPPGAYNIAADDSLTAADIVRELGFRPVPLPAQALYVAAGAAAQLTRLPLAPPVAEWIEAVSHPAIMDTSRAKAELGWKPSHSARDSLRETLGLPAKASTAP
jgi:nucleoside-diphosphate-sugar epimerase